MKHMIKNQTKMIEPTQALSFYIFRTQVTEKHVNLVIGKIPGREISEKLLERRKAMELVLVFVVGVIFGGILVRTLSHPKTVGTLRIDNSDPSCEPYLFLELTKANVYDIYHHKYVQFEVNNQNYTSQE